MYTCAGHRLTVKSLVCTRRTFICIFVLQYRLYNRTYHKPCQICFRHHLFTLLSIFCIFVSKWSSKIYFLSFVFHKKQMILLCRMYLKNKPWWNYLQFASYEKYTINFLFCTIRFKIVQGNSITFDMGENDPYKSLNKS